MAKTIEQVRQDANGRIGFIDNLLKNDKVYHPREWASWVVCFAALAARTETSLEGKDNIAQALALGPQRHSTLTIALNHTSDLDTGVLEYSFRTHGFRKLADNMVFAAGLKMWERPAGRFVTRAFNVVFVGTPFDSIDVEGVLRITDLTDEDRKLFTKYRDSLVGLNKAGFKKLLPELRSGRWVMGVYPESTRSRDGLIGEGRPETDPYFRLGGVILPILMEGTGEIGPRDTTFRFGKYIKEGMYVKVVAGRPLCSDWFRSKDAKKWFELMGENPASLVMAQIGSLDWDHVTPAILERYQRLVMCTPGEAFLDGVSK